jgi:hypothetical protein
MLRARIADPGDNEQRKFFVSTSFGDSPETFGMKIGILLLAAITSALATFALQPIAEAVVPPPDGGYPGGNTAEGQNALFSLTTGGFNTAVGFLSLRSETIGSFNTALGAGALFANTSTGNTATGAGALLSNNFGTQNTANGALALFSNTNGDRNTAVGFGALEFNIGGRLNTAVGDSALSVNNGDYNTGIGVDALASSASGGFNTAIGIAALFGISGDNNTAIGANALSASNGSDNTAIGAGALFDPAGYNNGIFSNTAIGANAGANLSSGAEANIDIGNLGVAGDSFTIRIGDDENQTRTFISGIFGVTTDLGGAVPVLVASDGQLGTISSSRRFKKEIRPMNRDSESILALKPVAFEYCRDTRRTPQFGLIAEEVAEVNPDLVVRDKNGEIYTVRYDAVNAMLLNEFLKEHRRVEELKSALAQQRKDSEAAIVQQQKTTEALVARLNEQEARIQKVSAQVEARKPASQTLAENQ